MSSTAFCAYTSISFRVTYRRFSFRYSVARRLPLAE